jgi:acyl-CoA synthetase (AMP-forming)/AMP-acid ligase II
LIELKSVSLMRGYFNDDVATHSCISENGWLRTGDLGFLSQEELYCLGRQKDVLIVAGRNVIAPEIDHLLSEAVGMEGSRIACFGYLVEGVEHLAISFEERNLERATAIAARLRTACFNQFGLSTVEMLAVPVGALPRTTSGKIRRRYLAELYRNGALETLAIGRVT